MPPPWLCPPGPLADSFFSSGISVIMTSVVSIKNVTGHGVWLLCFQCEKGYWEGGRHDLLFFMDFRFVVSKASVSAVW